MATQAPAKERGTQAEEQKQAPKADGSGRKPKQEQAKQEKAAAPKEPKQYVYGGSLEAPQPGANCRRLWNFLTANLSKAQVAKIKAELRKTQPADDRFVRWQRLVAACKSVGIEKVKVGDTERTVGQALVRSLQQEDKDGKMGKDTSITIL